MQAGRQVNISPTLRWAAGAAAQLWEGALTSFTNAQPAWPFHFGKLIPPRFQVQVPRNRDKPEYSASDVQSSFQQTSCIWPHQPFSTVKLKNLILNYADQVLELD